MRLYSLPLHFAFIVLALDARGQGTMIYDQQSATSQDLGVGGVPIEQLQPMGQPFAPALSSVGFVQFEFTDFNPGNGLGATVYVNLLAGSITGTVLDSTPFPRLALGKGGSLGANSHEGASDWG